MASAVETELRTAGKLRKQLGGISDVTLWRRINDPDLDFPQPIYIQGRRYWRAEEVEAWIEAQAARKAVPHPIPC
jgi:predicted DNA-binding transcriptional regulator AlpA